MTPCVQNGPLSLTHLQDPDHPSLAVAFNRTGERKASFRAGEELDGRHRARFQADDVESRTLHVHRRVNNRDRDRAQVVRHELVRDLSLVDKEQSDRLPRRQSYERRTEPEFRHSDPQRPRRLGRVPGLRRQQYGQDDRKDSGHRAKGGKALQPSPISGQSLLNGVR